MQLRVTKITAECEIVEMHRNFTRLGIAETKTDPAAQSITIWGGF